MLFMNVLCYLVYQLVYNCLIVLHHNNQHGTLLGGLVYYKFIVLTRMSELC